jgi:hypothetical protein
MARGTRKLSMLEQMGYGRKKAAPPPPTPEQKAAARALQEEYLRSMAPVWGVPADEVDAWIERTAA